MKSRLILALLAVGLAARAIPAAEHRLDIEPAFSQMNVVVKATAGSFTGKLSPYEPVIAVDDSGRVTSARLSFHFRDVFTGNEKRDRAMHAWQDTTTYPDGEFVLTSLAPTADGALTAIGRLTLHGVTRDTRFPVTITKDNSLYVIDGDTSIDTRDFGLPVIRMLALLKVDPVVHLRFHLQGKLSATATPPPSRL